MKKDKMIPRRHAVLRITGCLGAAVTARMMITGPAQTPGQAAVTPSPSPSSSSASAPAAGPVAAGPQAGAERAAAPLNPSAYRLRPMTSDSPPGLHRDAPPVREEPFFKLPDLGNSVVLTFDDGPDPRYTPQVLSVLREHDVRAMFFVCGEMASYNKALLAEVADAGHIVGNHTWTHPELPKLSRAKIRDEMERTSEVIEKNTGAAPLWFRAPYGSWNKHTFELGSELGMEPLAWTVDTMDWTIPGTDSIVKAVMDGAGPGVVVLSHDAGGNRSQSVAALRLYLPRLLAAGYRVAIPHR
jgi:peptidoglycan/xylan/chitin deacetylase (PgdA/CDA1 family)